MGRVQLAGVNAKPARDISIGNELRIKSGHGDFVVHVAGLSEFRGPASEAQKLYKETEESIEARKREVEMRRAMPPTEVDRVGKPSKRDRRQIDRLRRR